MKKPLIIFSGGGTVGPVAPLLAVAEILRKEYPRIGMHWAGTRQGPERKLAEAAGMTFTPFVWAKLRRYFDLRNILIPIWLKVGFFQAFAFLMGAKPRAVVSAGGFVSVPIVWAAWVLRIPVVIHQQDVRPGLANKLMAPFAKKMTVALEASKDSFPKAEVIGNPVRNMKPTTHELKLSSKKPVVLVMGGGTGAAGINRLVSKELCEVAQVIHLTGGREEPEILHPDYHPYPFLAEEFKEALNAADLVVTRAGMSSLSEIAALSKPAIIIPMPNSHQEDNAAFLKKADAAVVLNQKSLTPKKLCVAVAEALKNREMKERASRMHELFKPNAAKTFVRILKPYLD